VLEGVVKLLRCPHCAAVLAADGAALRCGEGHVFDVARQGYVSLLGREAATRTADSAEMVAARDSFLGAGHYDPLAALVMGACRRSVGRQDEGAVVDLGAGTGYHLAGALQALDGRVGLALDSSKFALRRAARAHPRIGAVACDVWGDLPVTDACAAIVLSVFAPRNSAEITRILRPGGTLVVVTPTRRHLRELIGPLGLLSVDEHKRERLDRTLGPRLASTHESGWEERMSLTRADVAALVAMGPSSRHSEPATMAQRIAGLPATVKVTASVTATTYRRA